MSRREIDVHELEERAEQDAARRYCPECQGVGGHMYGCPCEEDDGEYVEGDE